MLVSPKHTVNANIHSCVFETHTSVPVNVHGPYLKISRFAPGNISGCKTVFFTGASCQLSIHDMLSAHHRNNVGRVTCNRDPTEFQNCLFSSECNCIGFGWAITSSTDVVLCSAGTTAAEASSGRTVIVANFITPKNRLS